jgi:hypothetical protein
MGHRYPQQFPVQSAWPAAAESSGSVMQGFGFAKRKTLLLLLQLVLEAWSRVLLLLGRL